MSNRFWLAQAVRGSFVISGIIATFKTEQEAQHSRTEMQTNTHAGLSGNVFVIIDSDQLPVTQE